MAGCHLRRRHAPFRRAISLPEIREQTKIAHLRDEEIRGQPVSPDYFRLTPYEVGEAHSFERADGAPAQICRWIETSDLPILYLSGQSGTGESSLINAAVFPSLTATKWIVVGLRPHDSPLAEIKAALLQPSAIWRKPPAVQPELRGLIEQAADRVQRDGKRILLVIDQFEEALILCGEETKAAFASLLRELTEKPVPGLKILLSLRAEYLNDLPELGLQAPAFGPGQNAFEVRPFTRAAAQAFLEASGLNLGPALLAKMLEEAAEIEDMPDRVRPIVLNMFGLVVGSFKGRLPEGVKAGRLLSGYVERSLKSSETRGYAFRILRPLITDAGTKRPLATRHLAEQAGVAPLVARGCLLPLANDGLVRRLQGTPEKWEVAHDFVARLLQPLLRSWQRSAWDYGRTYLLPVPLLAWLLAMIGLIVFYPALHYEYIMSELRTVGLFLVAEEDGKLEFVWNGTSIIDAAHFWKVASLMEELSKPVAHLTIDSRSALTTLQGMPSLPALTTLDVGGTNVASLAGMAPLPALATFNLSHTHITSLEDMPSFPTLLYLDLSDSRLVGLEGMPSFPALKALNIYDTTVQSLKGMPSLPELIMLKPSQWLTSLEDMPSLPSLPELDLSNTKVASLWGMPSLPALHYLKLPNSNVTSLEGMPLLPALLALDLSNSNVTSLRGMPSLPNLQILDLSYSKVVSLKGMPLLPVLAQLVLSHSNVTSLEGIPLFPVLFSLDLSYTSVTSLKDMPSLPRLDTLDLTFSQVKDLRVLPPLPALKHIFLARGQIDPSKMPPDAKPKTGEIHKHVSSGLGLSVPGPLVKP